MMRVPPFVSRIALLGITSIIKACFISVSVPQARLRFFFFLSLLQFNFYPLYS